MSMSPYGVTSSATPLSTAFIRSATQRSSAADDAALLATLPTSVAWFGPWAAPEVSLVRLASS